MKLFGPIMAPSVSMPVYVEIVNAIPKLSLADLSSLSIFISKNNKLFTGREYGKMINLMAKRIILLRSCTS